MDAAFSGVVKSMAFEFADVMEQATIVLSKRVISRALITFFLKIITNLVQTHRCKQPRGTPTIQSP